MAVAGDVVQRAQRRVGKVIAGKWRLEKVLGVGGMATVYAAVHRNQNRVAIKMLHPEVSVSEMVRTRFLREGYAANSVNHEGAVRVQDDGVADDGSAYLVMELLDGEPLDDRADRHGGCLPTAEVLALADQLLDVLAVAHDAGVVHRDVKPDNLILTTRGELKVLDFGIARLAESTSDGSGTATGTFMGTPSFMAPEQARGRWPEVDARSDIWSVGATMFSLLTGRHVHVAETVSEQVALAVSSPAPPLAQVAPDVPQIVAQVVDRALAYDKAHRFESAREMRQAVRAAARKVGPPGTISVSPVARGQGADSNAPSTDGETMLAVGASQPGVAKSATLGEGVSASRPEWEPIALAPRRSILIGGMMAGTVILLSAGAWFLASQSPQPASADPASGSARPSQSAEIPPPQVGSSDLAAKTDAGPRDEATEVAPSDPPQALSAPRREAAAAKVASPKPQVRTRPPRVRRPPPKRAPEPRPDPAPKAGPDPGLFDKRF